MSYRIALNFEDGATRFIDCNEGEKVLDAAYRNKINLPMDCSDGVCGTCKCHCADGSYSLGDDYLENALTTEEAARGLVLTCQMVPSSDCVLAVPVPISACKISAGEHGGAITAAVRVSDSTFILELQLDRPELLMFLPGQYVNLAVPGTTERRAYSFSSKPGAERASFLIRNIPGGLMSRYLVEQAQPGQRMNLIGPFGSFFLRPVVRPLVMLAGGTGLAPLLSMLEVLTDVGTDQPIHLIYAVTADEDLVELPRIEALAKKLPTMTWQSCVADPQSAHPLRGYVTHHLTGEHLNAGNCDIYLCGPPPMVEAVRDFLEEKGVEPANLYYEKFSPSEAA